MSFWGKLFGNDDVISNGMDAIDKAFYTDEEKAENKQKLLDSYAPFKLAQRYFMMVVTVPYMALWLIVGVSLCIKAGFAGDFSEVKDYIMNGDIIWIVLAMASFYFGDTIVGKIKK